MKSNENSSSSSNNNSNDDDNTNDRPEIPRENLYCMVAKTVDDLMQAQKEDLLPDNTTGLVMGMGVSEPGRILYGAFQTLVLRGRISRTMLEQAMTFSPKAYTEYLPLWIRSLPAGQRSQYAHWLYKDKFESMAWHTDDKFFNFYNLVAQPSVSTDTTTDEDDNNGGKETDWIRRIQPPEPLGDNRHAARPAKAARLANDFYQLLNSGILFAGPNAGDVDAPFNLRECHEHSPESLDILLHYGNLFGINSQELPWEDDYRQFDVMMAHERNIMTVADLILRTWNALYFCQRLSITELEYALMQGGNSMHDLFCRGVYLALHIGYQGKPFATKGRHLFSQAQKCLDSEEFQQEVPFDPMPITDDNNNNGNSDSEVCLECDYCGEKLETSNRCSICKTAMYCNRDCQKKDWMRHKFLCPRYCKTPESLDS